MQLTVIWKTSDRVARAATFAREKVILLCVYFSLTLASLSANIGETRAKRAEVPFGRNLKGLSMLGLNCLPTAPTHRCGLKMH